MAEKAAAHDEIVRAMEFEEKRFAGREGVE
jgi:hypothetical protein